MGQVLRFPYSQKRKQVGNARKIRKKNPIMMLLDGKSDENYLKTEAHRN